MKMTLTQSDFRDAFRSMGRNDQFSYEGLGLLFDYLEELDPDYELDVVGLCCEFSESSVDQIAADYDIDVEGLDDYEKRDVVIEELEQNTSIVGETSDGSIVYLQF